MRPLSISAIIVAFISSVATAQQATSSVVRRTAVASPRSPAATRALAEKWRRRVDLVEGRAMSGESAWLAEHRAIGTTMLTSGDAQTTYLLVRRDSSSKPEVHARWDDLVIVRSGTGAIEMGDSLIGSTYRSPGERAGGEFTKSYQIVVHAGDVVRIPAAVPHAFIVSGTDALEYLVIKQRRQELPIRWFDGRLRRRKDSITRTAALVWFRVLHLRKRRK